MQRPAQPVLMLLSLALAIAFAAGSAAPVPESQLDKACTPHAAWAGAWSMRVIYGGALGCEGSPVDSAAGASGSCVTLLHSDSAGVPPRPGGRGVRVYCAADGATGVIVRVTGTTCAAFAWDDPLFALEPPIFFESGQCVQYGPGFAAVTCDPAPAACPA